MGRAHNPYEYVWAVIRFEEYATEPENQFTIKEIVRSTALAEAEADRLNRVNGGKQCRYFAQRARLFPPGASAGSAMTESQLPV